jgi:hypothetical protein
VALEVVGAITETPERLEEQPCAGILEVARREDGSYERILAHIEQQTRYEPLLEVRVEVVLRR